MSKQPYAVDIVVTDNAYDLEAFGSHFVLFKNVKFEDFLSIMDIAFQSGYDVIVNKAGNRQE